MSALLRADWLRLRRRRDLWVIGIGVLVFATIGYLAAYQRDATDPAWPTPAQIHDEVMSFTDFTGSGMTQAEIDEQISQMVIDQTAMYRQQAVEWEQQQAIELQRYDVAQSPFTLLGDALIPMLALLLITALVVGDEFRFNTIRTSLLAAADRRRFLQARLLSLTAITVALFGVILALGLVLAIGLRVVGAEIRSAPAVALVPALGWIGAQIVTALTLMLLATALTLMLRSGALTLLLILLFGLIEVFVLALPIFLPGEFLAGVPQAFLSNSVRTLSARLGYDSHAIALAQAAIPTAAVELPLLVVLGIVLGWAALFALIADRRLRTMDIVE